MLLLFVNVFANLHVWWIQNDNFNGEKHTGECRRLAAALRVLATEADDEFGARRDRVDAVEIDDVIDLGRPEVRTPTARGRHVHRLHPVSPTGVAAVQMMRWTAVGAKHLQNSKTEFDKNVYK